MSEPRASFVTKLYGFLPNVEKLLLVAAILGIIFKYQAWVGGNDLLLLSLSALAGVYYMMAFMRPPKSEDESVTTESGEKKGFLDLLSATIAPKLAWISCSVSVIGILFALFHFNGSREMLMIGTGANVLAFIVIAFGTAQGNEKVKAISGVLYRVVPLLGVSAYLLTRLSHIGN